MGGPGSGLGFGVRVYRAWGLGVYRVLCRAPSRAVEKFMCVHVCIYILLFFVLLFVFYYILVVRCKFPHLRPVLGGPEP